MLAIHVPLGQFLQDARATLSRAQTQTHEAFQRYTACLEAEGRARRDVAVAEQHRDELSMSTAALSGRAICDLFQLVSAILSRAQSSIGM